MNSKALIFLPPPSPDALSGSDESQNSWESGGGGGGLMGHCHRAWIKVAGEEGKTMRQRIGIYAPSTSWACTALGELSDTYLVGLAMPQSTGVSGATEATPRPHPHQDAGAAGWMRRQRAGVGGTLPYFLGSCLESGRQSQHLRGPLQSWALGSSAIHIPNLPSIPIPGSKFGNQ